MEYGRSAAVDPLLNIPGIPGVDPLVKQSSRSGEEKVVGWIYRPPSSLPCWISRCQMGNNCSGSSRLPINANPNHHRGKKAVEQVGASSSLMLVEEYVDCAF